MLVNHVVVLKGKVVHVAQTTAGELATSVKPHGHEKRLGERGPGTSGVQPHKNGKMK